MKKNTVKAMALGLSAVTLAGAIDVTALAEELEVVPAEETNEEVAEAPVETAVVAEETIANEEIVEELVEAAETIDGVVTDEETQTVTEAINNITEAIDEINGLNDATAQSNAEYEVNEAINATAEANQSYLDAVKTQTEAQAALDKLLFDNGLAIIIENEDGTTSYEYVETILDENGNLKEDIELSGDAKVAVDAAQAAVAAAGKVLSAKEAELGEERKALAEKILALQEEIKTTDKYWTKTQKMNEYLITYKLLSEGATNIVFSDFVKAVPNQTTYINDNYVRVTYVDASGQTQEEYFNYHKEDGTVNDSNDEKYIWVDKYDKQMKDVVDIEAYTTYERTVDNSSIILGENATSVGLKDSEDKAVLGEVKGETSNDVAATVTTGDAKNGTVTTKKVTGTTTEYERTQVEVVDQYGTMDVTAGEASKKSDAKRIVAAAFDDDATTKVTVTFTQLHDSKIFHATTYTYTYESVDDFNKKFENEVLASSDYAIIEWYYKIAGVKPYTITVTKQVEDQNNIVSSHKADAVIERTLATVEETTTTTTTTVTNGAKVNGAFKSSKKYATMEGADENTYNQLVKAYKDKGYKIENESGYSSWSEGEGKFDAVSADGLTRITVSYDLENHFDWGIYSTVNYSESIATTVVTTSTATKQNVVKSEKTYLADIYSKVDHDAVTHQELDYLIKHDYKEEFIYTSESQFMGTDYVVAKNNKKDAEDKLDKLVKAIDGLCNLKTTLAEGQFTPIPVIPNRRPGSGSQPRFYPAATLADIEQDSLLDTDLMNIPDAQVPLAGDNVRRVRTAGTNDAGAAVEEEAEGVVIEEEETPLAAEKEDVDTTVIGDEATPLAAEEAKRNWWWLILVALGVAGVTTYEYDKKRKEREAEEAGSQK